MADEDYVDDYALRDQYGPRGAITEQIMAQQGAVDPWSQLPASENVEYGDPSYDSFLLKTPTFQSEDNLTGQLGQQMGNQDIYEQIINEMWNTATLPDAAVYPSEFYVPQDNSDLTPGSLGYQMGNQDIVNQTLPEEVSGVPWWHQLEDPTPIGPQNFFDSSPYADAGASGLGSYAAPGPYGSNRRANL